MTPIASRLQQLALLSTAVLMVTACGGGGGGDGSPPPPSQTPAAPAPSTVSGIVLMPVSASGVPTTAPATVCYDSNQNSACDASEPSTTTDSQGAYTLNGLPATQPAGTAVVAQIPAGTTTAALTVQAPVSRPEIIDALTTMVQVGVAQGMAVATAEAAVARQFQISTAALYGNYRNLPLNAERNWLVTLAGFIHYALQNGAPLRVGPVASPTAGYEVTSLLQTDATSYRLNYVYSTHVADAATGMTSYHLLSSVFSGGQQLPATVQIDPSWHLSPSGWRSNYTQGYTQNQTAGNPSVTLSSTGAQSIVFAQEVDVSGRTLGEVVTLARTTSIPTGNTTSTLYLPASVNVATLTGTMPTGAKVRVIRSSQMVTPTQYREADRLNTIQNSLSGLMSAYPALPAGTAAGETNTLLVGRGASTSASLGTPGTMRSCNTSFGTDAQGNSFCVDADIRVSFDGTGTAANFYVCDYMFDGTPGSTNCRSLGVASTSLGLLEDGATPRLSFGALPTAATTYLPARLLIERSGRIYKGTPGSKALANAVGVVTRLGRTAFTALAAALNIPAPNPNFTTPSPYMGVWRTTFAGTESGNCDVVLVDALGDLGGACTSNLGASFNLVGAVSGQGATSANASVSNTAFTGLFSTTSATGTWHHPTAAASGTWSATKY
ncbi:hypothetical protein ACVNIS_03875 [Sphaerotilaceae bacterium SBD11-9]